MKKRYKVIQIIIIVICIINFIILSKNFLNFILNGNTTKRYGLAVLFLILNLIEVIYLFILLRKENKIIKQIIVYIPTYYDNNYVKSKGFLNPGPLMIIMPSYYNMYMHNIDKLNNKNI